MEGANGSRFLGSPNQVLASQPDDMAVHAMQMLGAEVEIDGQPMRLSHGAAVEFYLIPPIPQF